jgi:hypothetical protein
VRRRLAPALILGAVAVAIWITFPRWTVDDAYISFRYASNLAHHGRLAWNLTGDPVEGYTGVLLPLLIAGFLRAGVAATVASQIVGTLSFAGCTWMLVRILRRMQAPPPVVFGVAAVFGLAPFLYTHAFAGLETMLFSFLLLLAIDRAVNDGSRRRWWWLAWSCTALSAARPEGIFFSGLLIAAALLQRRSEWRAAAAAMLAGYVLPFGAYFAWRWAYYGRLFPNTYYVKAASGFFPIHVSAAARWWTLYLAVPVALLAHVLPRTARPDDRRPVLIVADAAGIASAIALLLLRLQDRTSIALVVVAVTAAFLAAALRRPEPAALPITVVASASIVVVTKYLSTDLLMNYSYRFFAPFFAVALLAAATTVRRPPAKAMLALVLVIPLYAGQLRTERTITARYQRAQRDEHIAIGRDLRKTLPKGSRIAVHFDAGAIPYYAGSEYVAIDFGRLNDEYLTNGGDGVEYFFRNDVDALVATSLDRTELVPLAYENELRAITTDPRFMQRYRLWRRYTTADQPYSEFVYLRQ